MKKKDGLLKEAAFLLAILVLLAVALFSILQILEKTVFYRPPGEEETVVRKTVTHNGVDYYPRQDITTILVMGIDRFGVVEDSGASSNSGHNDLTVLLIVDESRQVCDVLHINRDTMMEVRMLGLDGRFAGTWFGQLAVAHTSGTGLKDSAENVAETLSDFLGGVRIDHYVAMNMDAIAILNDAVGGVTVTVTEDFSAVDPEIPMGEVKLMGNHALNFVRTRKDVGDQLNLSRIERHKEYMDGFVEAFRAKRATGADFILDAYEAVAPYMVTDCSANLIASMIQRYEDYQIGQILSPAGENVMGETYFEFHADEAALKELVLQLFYAEKESSSERE